MDASTATATTANLFAAAAGNMDQQKFDLAALLRNVAAAAAASATTTVSSATTVTSSSTATSPNSVESSSSTNGGPVAIGGSPSPPHPAELKPIPASSLAPPGVVQRRQLSFSPIKPIYAPSGHGRQILIYDSRSHPGRRREFAYKTRFTNQSGLTTVYYRCMACRALRHRLQRSLPREKLPAVPCIAVKNDLLINDPDFPEASDHFCTPLTIGESDQRLRNTFERGHKRARMKMANSTVEETIRKVGKLRAEEAEEAEADMSMDLWHGAGGDGSSSSALNGHLDGSDCSSDSTVDVLKEESPDDDLLESSSGYSQQHEKLLEEGEKHGGGDEAMMEEEEDEETRRTKTVKKVEPCEEAKQPAEKQHRLETANISSGGPLGANGSPFVGSPGATGRSPRKKLDSLLKIAEMRAAAANGSSIGINNVKEEEKSVVAERPNGGQAHQRSSQQLANGGTATATAIPSPLPIHLNSLLSAQFPPVSMAGHQQQQQPNNASVQSIQAIAARLSRGGSNAASELSKALAGMKSPAMGQHQQQQHQHKGGNAGMFLMNGGDKLAGAANLQFSALNGAGPIPPAMGLHIAELLKKYVENNLEMAPETAGNARSAGELACALFMAQMVENAELRQEVQKLRCELDSLKALVAAAAVVQNNNNSNGHHHRQQKP